MRGIAAITCFGLSTWLAASPLAAQSRADLIERARSEFSDAAALGLLVAAADPSRGQLDSLWAVSAQEIALRLIDQNDPDAAAVWLRWAARHGAGWSIDRTWFPPAVVAAYDGAAAEARLGPADSAAVTSWVWPAAFVAGAQGSMRLASGPPDAVVEVVGWGPLQPGSAMPLAAGTYELSITGTGYEALRVEREVLPGATTVIDIDLPPVLSAAVEARLRASSVMIRGSSGGQAFCVNAAALPGQFGVTVRSGLPRTDGLDVERGGQIEAGTSVMSEDAALDLAMVQLPVGGGVIPEAAPVPAPGQYAWAVFRPGCGEPVAMRTRLVSTGGAGGAMIVSPTLPAGARGAPLVDAAGRLLGVVTAPERVVPTGSMSPLIASAVARPPVPQVRSGGFPVVWLGAGAAAAGLAAFLLSQGGGESTPDTGEIVITIPSGL